MPEMCEANAFFHWQSNAMKQVKPQSKHSQARVKQLA